MTRALPAGFVMGCATSAFQIEGGIHNDWTDWSAAGRSEHHCGAAVDHWNRWAEDFDLLQGLGAQAYRFSIEWARVEPQPGVYDEAALAQYAAMAKDLRARGIEPCVTLLHFTHPSWFHATCPWHDEAGDAPARFARFVERVVQALEGTVTMFTVLNEPGVWLSAAYLGAAIPPGRKDITELAAAGAQMLRAHAAAARVLRARVPQVRIGVAHNMLRFWPDRPAHPLDRLASSYVARAFNHALPRALTTGRWQLGLLPGLRRLHHIPELIGSVDFFGVNYYSRLFVRADVWPKPNLELVYEDRDGMGVTDLGWEVHPQGMQESLQEMASYGLPLYVTENGLDDRSDSRRSAHLYDHLDAVLRAKDAGVDVRGYFHWSLMDNFEWLEGFEPRFGLYRVDRQTLQRTETRGAALFRQVCAERRLPAQRPAQTRQPGTRRVPLQP